MQNGRMTQIDSKDLALLAQLQRNGQISALELADILGMSASQIGRRKQRLESEGYILNTPARLNANLLGLSVQAFIQIQTDAQTSTTHAAITDLITRTDEIVAAWTLTGDADYIFRVYCRDLHRLNELVQTVLLPHPAIGRVQSQIVMDQLKDDTALPLKT
jgi:DNA-binding Lrp family transcriptional regulator